MYKDFNPDYCPLIAIYDLLCFASVYRLIMPAEFKNRFCEKEINSLRFFVYSLNENVQSARKELSSIDSKD